MQSQNISIYRQVDFEISHILESSILNFKLLERFGEKTMCSCKNRSLNCQNTNTLYRFPNCKSIFLKINFSPICYDIFNEIALSQERNGRFHKFLHQNRAERTSI